MDFRRLEKILRECVMAFLTGCVERIMLFILLRKLSYGICVMEYRSKESVSLVNYPVTGRIPECRHLKVIL